MPKKKIKDAFFQVRLTDTNHKELMYIARKRGFMSKRFDRTYPNKSEALRALIREEATRLRKQPT